MTKYNKKVVLGLIAVIVLFISILIYFKFVSGEAIDISGIGTGEFMSLTTDGEYLYGCNNIFDRIYKLHLNGTYTNTQLNLNITPRSLAFYDDYFYALSISGNKRYINKIDIDGFHTGYTFEVYNSCSRDIDIYDGILYLNCGSKGNNIRGYYLNGTFISSDSLLSINNGVGIRADNDYLHIIDSTNKLLWRINKTSMIPNLEDTMNISTKYSINAPNSLLIYNGYIYISTYDDNTLNINEFEFEESEVEIPDLNLYIPPYDTGNYYVGFTYPNGVYIYDRVYTSILYPYYAQDYWWGDFNIPDNAEITGIEVLVVAYDTTDNGKLNIGLFSTSMFHEYYNEGKDIHDYLIELELTNGSTTTGYKIGNSTYTWRLNLTNDLFKKDNLTMLIEDSGGFGNEYIDYIGIRVYYGACNIFINDTSPIEHPKTFRVWTDCDSDYKLYVNSEEILNNTEINQGVGAFNCTVIRDDKENYSNTYDEKIFVVNKNSGLCDVLFNESSGLMYPKTFKVFTNCDSDYKLYLNGSEISNNSIINRGVNTFNFSVIRNDKTNYSNTYDEKLFILIKNNNIFSVFFNELSPLEYSTSFRAWTNSFAPYVLRRNSDIITNNSLQTLSSGVYNFSVSISDTQNFSNLYSSVLFSIIDTTSPKLSILEPIDGESFTSNIIDLNFTASDDGVGLDKCWYLNNTGNNITIDCSKNTTISQSVDGTYTIYLWANDTNGNLAYTSHIWTISANAPSINLVYPSNNYYYNYKDNIELSFVAEDSNGISVCELWTNTTGVWHKNQTLTKIDSGKITDFSKFYLDDNMYIWNVWCNDSTGLPNTDSWSTLNRSFTVDTIYPIIFFEDNNTAIESLSHTIQFNITEKNPSKCMFTLRNATGDVHNYPINNTLSCGLSSISISTLEYGNYTFELWSTDKAGNSNYSTYFFSSTEPEIPSSSGGGGGSVIVIGNVSWSVSTESGSTKYQLNMLKGISRSKSLLFENFGSEEVIINLGCQYVSGEIDLCDYILFDYLDFNLPVEMEAKTVISFTLAIPDDITPGDYKINLEAVDNDNNAGLITAEINVGTGKKLVDIATKFVSSKHFGKVKVPYVIIFVLIWGLLSTIFSFTFKNMKMKANVGLGVLISIFLSLFALIFI